MKKKRHEDYLSLFEKDFGKSGVEEYRKRRYRGIDQRIVHFLETALVKGWIRQMGSVERILDVPCGYGRMVSTFPQEAKAVGADLSMNMLSLARARYTYVVRASLWTLPFASGSFDVVLCIRVLHHAEIWKNAEKIFAELARVSRKNVIVSVYEDTRFHRMWRKVKGKGRIIFVEEKDVIRLAELTGLRLRDRRHILPFIHAQTFYWFEKIS